MRRVQFQIFETEDEKEAVFDAFERGGFFDQYPENCIMRSGAFIMWDIDRKRYVVVICRNNNSLNLWQ